MEMRMRDHGRMVLREAEVSVRKHQIQLSKADERVAEPCDGPQDEVDEWTRLWVGDDPRIE
ncbi:hypothetical protein Dimus_027017, partial [Dionaea muscipula]